jgi:hypothetical protein
MFTPIKMRTATPRMTASMTNRTRRSFFTPEGYALPV